MKKNITRKKITGFFILLILSAISLVSQAREVNIKQNLPYVDIEYKNNIVRIERNQDPNHTLQGGFSKTSRNCPPFCVQPISPAPGIKAVGELEVIEFIDKDVKQGTGVLIDARTPSWHNKGTIPGSVNIPFTDFGLDTTDEKLLAIFKELGVTPRSKSSDDDSFWSWASFGNKEKNTYWNFSKAKDLLLWCNGMWCGQSPRAIKNLLNHGYPANKIKYFRGGMQTWLILGLTVIKP